MSTITTYIENRDPSRKTTLLVFSGSLDEAVTSGKITTGVRTQILTFTMEYLGIRLQEWSSIDRIEIFEKGSDIIVTVDSKLKKGS